MSKKQNKWNDPFYANARCSQSGNYSKYWMKWLSIKKKRTPFLKGTRKAVK